MGTLFLGHLPSLIALFTFMLTSIKKSWMSHAVGPFATFPFLVCMQVGGMDGSAWQQQHDEQQEQQQQNRKRGRPAGSIKAGKALVLSRAVSAHADGTVTVLLACGMHTATRMLESFSKRQQRARGRGGEQGSEAALMAPLYCRVCDTPADAPGVTRASVGEQRLYALMAAHFSDRIWLHEHMIMGRLVDVWLPELKVAVQADGRHHTNSTEQRDSDIAFENQVMAGGGAVVKGMVRLHTQDTTGVWHACLSQALAQFARNRRVVCFVVCSPASNRGPPRVVYA